MEYIVPQGDLLKDNKQYIFSDPNIRVACLTCLGAIVSLPLPLMEVWSVLHPGGRLHSISHSAGVPGNAGISGCIYATLTLIQKF